MLMHDFIGIFRYYESILQMHFNWNSEYYEYNVIWKWMFLYYDVFIFIFSTTVTFLAYRGSILGHQHGELSQNALQQEQRKMQLSM